MLNKKVKKYGKDDFEQSSVFVNTWPIKPQYNDTPFL